MLINRAKRSLFRIRQRVQPDFLAELLYETGARWREGRMLKAARAADGLCWTEPRDDSEPLVTVRIATFNRPDLLVERAVASALAQTYRNIEILVVGDGCAESTAEALSAVNDERLRYVNLPRQGRYPEAPPRARWHAAGTWPMNAAMFLAKGDWFAPCDDDDELTPDHVERLLRFAKESRVEFVWSKSQTTLWAGEQVTIGSPTFGQGMFTQGSVLFSAGLREFLYSPRSWCLLEAHDWNLWKRMHRAGVRVGFLDRVTYRYWQAGHVQYRVP